MIDFSNCISQGVAFIFFVIGLVLGYIARFVFAGRRVRQMEAETKQALEKARLEAENIKKQAEVTSKDFVIKLRQDFEEEVKGRREEVQSAEKRLSQKEENLEKHVDLLDRKEKDINQRFENLKDSEAKMAHQTEQLKSLVEEEKKRLETLSSMTPQEARKLLLSRLDEDLTQEKAARIRQAEEDIKKNCDKKAREIISVAIQRCASDHTAESTVAVVSLPSDEMKGRIIGREGRNIRALEAATGVDVIIDDTPEAVTVSCFDLVRREIAKIALENLIADGRIHPGRIEEVVDKAKQQLEGIILEEGQKAAFELDIHDMHPELLKFVGKLKFRTSFGQNGLFHTKEVAFLNGVIASKLGLDPKIAIRAGLLHDIGKVVSSDVEEGTHAIVGANLARKYGESEDVARAVESHHEEVEMSSLYGILVCAADAISAARPGARAESLETYVKRLENLEKIANDFKGVNKAYALQAGREIRIVVNPGKINDDEAIVLARDVRKRIEEEMEYPGHIKVIVFREVRAVEYAK